MLLPVWNAGRYLNGCLRSLSRQTFSDFEVVAVDDGSDDGSGRTLDAWAGNNPGVRVFHRSHRGLVAALNAGLELCRGDLVARMDADDAAHPKRLELQAALLADRPGVDVVSCLVRHIPVHRIAGGLQTYEEWLNGLRTHEAMFRERFVESPLAHPSAVVRRPVLERVGGWRDAGWAEDHDLWLRLFENGSVFAKVPRVLYFWRDHPGRLTRADVRYSKERFLRLKARFLARGPLAGSPPVVVWGAGPTGRRLARALEAEGIRAAAFVDIDPAKVGRTVRGVSVADAAELPDGVVVVAVAARGARALIRERLCALGLSEGTDFWCAA